MARTKTKVEQSKDWWEEEVMGVTVGGGLEHCPMVFLMLLITGNGEMDVHCVRTGVIIQVAQSKLPMFKPSTGY
jgi:hypothetical protein